MTPDSPTNTAGRRARTMTRRALLSAGAASAVSAASGFGQRASALGQPNVIIITCDDLAMSVYQKSTGLRRLLESQGRRFTNAIATVPSCGPSRSCLFTGRYPHNHGVVTNTAPQGGWSVYRRRGNEQDNLAVRLQRAGYRTGLIGKYLNDYETMAIDHVPPGWDEWHGWAGRGKYDRYRMNDNGTVSFYDVRDGQENYETDRYATLAAEFIAASAPLGPFFLYLAPHAPHMPALSSREYRTAKAPRTGPRTLAVNEADVSDKPNWIRAIAPLTPAQMRRSDKRFQDQVRSMLPVEDLLRTVLAALDAAGARENTWILFTSDNGFFYGEHRIASGKGALYEEGINVPFVAIGPGVRPGQNNAVISMTDIAPTVLALAGQDASDLDGRSFAQALRQHPSPFTGAPAMIRYGDSPYPVVESRAFDDDAAPRGGACHGLRGADWAFISMAQSGECEFYDLRTDPMQLVNLWGSLSETARTRLKDSLGAMARCQGVTCRGTASTIPLSAATWRAMV
jgi:arylsulfatase A-like enzyme